MLADPLSVTFASTTFSMARISTDVDGSTYLGTDPSDPTHKLELRVEHKYGTGPDKARSRRVLRLTRSWLSADPRVAGQHVPLSQTVTCTFDAPDLAVQTDGYYLVVGLISLLSTASYQNLNKVLLGET
jgi:hypothetical protein